MVYSSSAATGPDLASDPAMPPRAQPGATGRDRLVLRITELVPAIRKAFEVKPKPGERATWMSLTPHQLEALAALDHASLTMRELCERLHISESAGTALSDRLVAHGMVTREADPADRRVVRLSLGDDARAMVARFRELKRRRIAEVLGSLNDDELAALTRIYERLASSVGGVTRTGAPGIGGQDTGRNR